MPYRYLFGPVTALFAAEQLHGPRQAGHCLAFDPAGATDLALGWNDTWDSVQAKLPPGWRPDFVVLYLPYTTVPRCLWNAPVPLVGWAADWNLLWHGYRRTLPYCDLVLTDTTGVEVMAREGISHTRVANLYGCGRSFLEAMPAGSERDIDILFVGNLHPAVQRERLSWLGRLARRAGRWRVVIATGVFGAEYRALLARSRIVFNRGIRGECNQRTFEAAAAGALLFQEAENREVPAYFHDRQECVCYTANNLEALLDHYLTHEDERRTLAEAARARLPVFTFESLWAQALDGIEREWPTLQERARQRQQAGVVDDLPARCWQALSSTQQADATLVHDLAALLAVQPQAAAVHNALGLAVSLAERDGSTITVALAEKAASYFRRALACDPTHAMAGLNLVEALVGLGQKDPAIEQARRTLAVLDAGAELDPSVWDGGHFPPCFDHFRVEWERAAWLNAGQPAAEIEAKRLLLRWRLHNLLAELTGDPAHAYEAALARPELPTTRAALGVALARTGRPAEAAHHLREAVRGNPFDVDAAASLFHVLGDLGDADGQRRLAHERRLLVRAASQVVPAEAWFAEAPPVGDELASIIVLCCNQLEYTRLCLESVLRHTRPPYELVLVDNGSTDGTAAYLEEVRARPGPVRVEVIRNATNRGFPAGCNQALAHARGEYLLFLNNDTIATEGWLEGLIAWALHDWPQVGLVGAVTNYAPDPQHVPAGYTALDGLAAFAAQRRRDHAGKAVRVDRLSGFCLLARRDVLQRVGGFDERFGIGFFDDDDLCVRVREAGYQLLVALNVYLHHFGSRTFAGLGLDCRQQLAENFERFQAKWGPERVAGYRLPLPALTRPGSPGPPEAASAAPAPTIVVTPQVRRPRVSLCLIVKNEEANLPDCLGPITGLVDEIIVVDTGSTDRTKEVAARFGARVFDFPWVDSFAAARNESLRHATGDWIFWLDADDRLDEENRPKLRALFAGLGKELVGYVMKCRCLPDPESRSATVVDHVRLFPNHPQLRWQHRVHEQILPALRELGGEVRWADVVIQHVGYQDLALRRRKLERDRRLLGLEQAEQPEHPFTLFNLGSIHHELEKPAEALPLLHRSLALSHPTDSIVRKLYALIAQCHRQLGQKAEALAACQEGRGHYPDDIELLFLEGLIRRETGDLPGAEACLLRLLQTRPGKHFGSVDAGLAGYKARHQLALIYRAQGRAAEAEAQWRAAVAEQPDFLPAWLGLGELCLEQQRWAELEQAATRLEPEPQTAPSPLSPAAGERGRGEGAVEAAVLRARGQLIRKEFALARQVLEPVVTRAPQAVWPRVILSHVLLQEGRDWAAAERVLREVLALDPGHAEAQRNLAVLLRQQGRRDSARDGAFGVERTLAELYEMACTNPSPLNQHLPRLCALARECAHVTELGTGRGTATTALLHAQPDRLVGCDQVRHPQVDMLGRLAGRTEFVFRQMDVLHGEIEETDLLFIDTRHDYEQLKEELRQHAGKVRRYLVLPGTSTHSHDGETVGSRGLWPAVEEFLTEGTFRLVERRHDHGGLTVLEAARARDARTGDGAPGNSSQQARV